MRTENAQKDTKQQRNEISFPLFLNVKRIMLSYGFIINRLLRILWALIIISAIRARISEIMISSFRADLFPLTFFYPASRTVQSRFKFIAAIRANNYKLTCSA